MKLVFIVCNNLYSSKFHFTQKLAEALRRKGVEVIVRQWMNGPVPDEIVNAIKKISPTLSLSFNQPGPLPDQSYFFENIQVPHLTLLLDPAIYDINLASSPYALVSCVDHNDCQMFEAAGLEKTFFFPHGIEKDLSFDSKAERPLDVVFIGTCYDPDNLFEWWRGHYPKEMCDVIERAIHIGLSDNCTSFNQAVIESLMYHGLSPKDMDVLRIAYYVDFYIRGIERVELIRSIKDAEVHIYGAASSWREETPIKSWEGYFSGQKNVVIHPAIEYGESLEILKQSKICLNSMPMFKNGSHERILASLACGALPFTSDNLYVRDQFVDGEDLVLFQFENLSEVNAKVNHYLANEDVRKQLVNSGRNKVMAHHTWDNRADLLIENIKKWTDNGQKP